MRRAVSEIMTEIYRIDGKARRWDDTAERDRVYDNITLIAFGMEPSTAGPAESYFLPPDKEELTDEIKEEPKNKEDKDKLLHISYGTEKTESGVVGVPLLLDQVTDTVNSRTPGWKMQKRLDIGITDASWFSVWEKQLEASDGVVIFNTETYRSKLKYGGQLQAEGTQNAEGMGIKREADRIIQERDKRGESFRVFVVDGTDVGPEGLRNRLQDGHDQANYAGWKDAVREASVITPPADVPLELKIYDYDLTSNMSLAGIAAVIAGAAVQRIWNYQKGCKCECRHCDFDIP